MSDGLTPQGDRKSWMKQEYGQATLKAREHLDSAEKGGRPEPGGLTYDGHLKLAEAWSRYALAVKP